jgi:hypothetical protein
MAMYNLLKNSYTGQIGRRLFHRHIECHRIQAYALPGFRNVEGQDGRTQKKQPRNLLAVLRHVSKNPGICNRKPLWNTHRRMEHDDRKNTRENGFADCEPLIYPAWRIRRQILLQWSFDQSSTVPIVIVMPLTTARSNARPGNTNSKQKKDERKAI